jgi:hypothetical protein
MDEKLQFVASRRSRSVTYVSGRSFFVRVLPLLHTTDSQAPQARSPRSRI